MSKEGAPEVIVRLPSHKTVITLEDKAKTMTYALTLVVREVGLKGNRDRLRHSDMAVLWYILASINRATGEAIRKYETIADANGISRGEACKSIGRWKKRGVLEAQPRRRPGRLNCFFNFVQLVAHVGNLLFGIGFEHLHVFAIYLLLKLLVRFARRLDLPSTPLKETEKRADKWREDMGWEQTEIDALATLQPGVLRRIVNDALAPFYDHTLNDRVYAAKSEWERAF